MSSMWALRIHFARRSLRDASSRRAISGGQGRGQGGRCVKCSRHGVDRRSEVTRSANRSSALSQVHRAAPRSSRGSAEEALQAQYVLITMCYSCEPVRMQRGSEGQHIESTHGCESLACLISKRGRPGAQVKITSYLFRNGPHLRDRARIVRDGVATKEEVLYSSAPPPARPAGGVSLNGARSASRHHPTRNRKRAHQPPAASSPAAPKAGAGRGRDVRDGRRLGYALMRIPYLRSA